ncbi:hypothetical protein MTAT_04820 [Moorella thermoacetica]|uniref:Uncharacterized protein n=1 Tax=Neomoorella thermoacetica TaxID=1525 RepID=A0AAC9MUN5_NEOTH|nr:hypothetical protein [Moorella thermoacetica]AOQ23849.1 hypothetical protein Maut_01404 [Moorella thermoacetica]TYL14253.1 hypothetical protein MTAT_04820 [Moorella thermoacetica]
MNRYWETEQPIEVASKKNKLRWFPQAGQLQVSRPDWTDENGQVKPGKTVTLDVKALSEGADRETALEVFEAIVKMIEAD